MVWVKTMGIIGEDMPAEDMSILVEDEFGESVFCVKSDMLVSKSREHFDRSRCYVYSSDQRGGERASIGLLAS